MLYHATHLKNAYPITQEGILTCHSTGALELVWLVERSMISYAVHHVAKRHGWDVRDVCVVEVDETNLNPWGSAWPGIFRSPADVMPARLGKWMLPVMHALTPEVIRHHHRQSSPR